MKSTEDDEVEVNYYEELSENELKFEIEEDLRHVKKAVEALKK